MQWKRLFFTLAMAAMSAEGHAAQGGDAAALAPTGTLRVGLVEAPNAGVLFVRREADGAPTGVTADLGAALAQRAGVPFKPTIFPNTGAVVDAIRAGAIDVGFMPIDAERRGLVDFGPGYYQIESTYLVSGASGITTVEAVDHAGLRVIAIANTTTLRASARSLRATAPVAVATVAEAIALMRTGKADAFALSRDTLQPMVSEIAGSRIVSGHFQQTLIAPAVPQGRPAALAFVTSWLDGAKTSGEVRRIFDAHGLKEAAVAP